MRRYGFGGGRISSLLLTQEHEENVSNIPKDPLDALQETEPDSGTLHNPHRNVKEARNLLALGIGRSMACFTGFKQVGWKALILVARTERSPPR
jgi:hypothetical protein